MSIFLNSNISSHNAQRNLNFVTGQMTKSLERLSSGYKINRASDGPGQLLLSENLRSQIRGTDVAMQNVQQGLSMLQTADSALQQITGHLQSMREIALAASNSTTTADQFSAYQADYAALSDAINAIAANTNYNGTALLSATAPTVSIQAGANSGDDIDISAAFTDNTATALTVDNTTLTTASEADTLLGEVDAALATVAANLATVGGFERQMSDQLNFLSIAKENYTASEAAIRNTDVAAETANLSRLQILQQAAAYSLSQANSMPSIAMRLLQ